MWEPLPVCRCAAVWWAGEAVQGVRFHVWLRHKEISDSSQHFYLSGVFLLFAYCITFFSEDTASTCILLWFICWHFLTHCAWHAHAVHVIRLAGCQYCAGGIALQASLVEGLEAGLWETCVSYDG